MATSISGNGQINGITLPTVGFGKVVNAYFAQATNNAALTNNVANYAEVACPDATLTVTPASAASRFIVLFTTRVNHYFSVAAVAFTYEALNLYRGSTSIGLSTSASSSVAGTNPITGTSPTLHIATIDSPATTSPVTYSAKVSGDCSTSDFSYAQTNKWQFGPRSIVVVELAS